MKYLFILTVLLCPLPLAAGQLLINEFTTNSPGGDWVELFYYSEERESLDISPLFVTMYYGSNEPLAAEAVTLYSYDRPETPYDDRFAVVHLTDPFTPDETDRTGDSNGNGVLDLYCNNYSSSLWNTDGVIAIDTDDEPANGGILDFAAYSNQDGSPNSTIVAYVRQVHSQEQWSGFNEDDPQSSMIGIGLNGLGPTESLARTGSADTNGPGDFRVTRYLTPGRANVLFLSGDRDGRLFRPLKKRITCSRTSWLERRGRIELDVYASCNLRFRIFSTIGMMIYESPLQRDIPPGRFAFDWNLEGRGRPVCTGLYLCRIEATSGEKRKCESQTIFIIVSTLR